MLKETLIQQIRQVGLVAVIRAEDGETAIRITEACLEGGAAAVEITFTVPAAHRVIAQVRSRFGEKEIILGAGTVLDPETARIALLEGASYIVSPCLNVDTVRLCNRYRVPCMAGAMTIREVQMAMEAGCDIVKIFPGETFGPAFIKSVRGPLPQAQLMPTGGVSVDNCAQWIAAGAVAVGAGSQLTGPATHKDWAGVTTLAKKFMAAIKAARGE